MKNSWNYDLPRIEDIIAVPHFAPLIWKVTRKMLRAVGESPAVIDEIVALLFDAGRSLSVLELEQVLHQRIHHEISERGKWRQGMYQRAEVIVSEIEKYFQGDSLADVGCGHGLVAWLSRKHFKDILLVDISDYRDVEVALRFVEYAEGERPPLGHSFDCTLLITVLHHARDPLSLLESVWRQTERRLIVIESVFGVHASQAESPLPHLDQQTQLAYAVFCDWFYNRVLNQGVSVPYNFNTPEKWREVFKKLPAVLAFENDLGVDLDIVPEHHFLFVLDKGV
jgi:ubiquinone/menaquinone biosynthesis C-methylase UbiE